MSSFLFPSYIFIVAPLVVQARAVLGCDAGNRGVWRWGSPNQVE